MNRISKWLVLGAGLASAAYATSAASTWLRFGRRRPSESDALLDRFLADPDICEQHEVAIAAPADVTFAAVKDLELDSSRIIRLIFKTRALILRSGPDVETGAKGLLAQMTAIGWGVLAERDHEIVMGAVTQPWRPNPVFRALPPDQFAAFAEPDHVKIAWTLRADPNPDGSSTFRTETRAVATDSRARRKFRAYWSLLSPGIILIRKAMLPVAKAAAERRWRVAGDDLLADARAALTHAITIDAPPKDVWPWLLQMGGQRAGWYSWDALDNAGKPSAERIIPSLQQLAVGDVLPARPVGDGGFKVLRIVPERSLVLSSLTPKWEGTWAFELVPLGADRCRLVTRYRAAYPPNARMALALPLLAAIHQFMESKQLRTIKHHAEHVARPTA